MSNSKENLDKNAAMRAEAIAAIREAERALAAAQAQYNNAKLSAALNLGQGLMVEGGDLLHSDFLKEGESGFKVTRMEISHVGPDAVALRAAGHKVRADGKGQLESKISYANIVFNDDGTLKSTTLLGT